MKSYRSLSWLEWSFSAAVLLGLLSCGALLLINQFQQEAAERIVWWNKQIGNDESRRMYQGWITSVEHQQQQTAFIQTISCWGWRCSIAIAVFCWLSVLTLHPRRALQMLAFVSLWIRFRWAARFIRRWRNEEPQRIGYFQLTSAILLIVSIIGMLYIPSFDTFRLWKILEFSGYVAFIFFVVKTALLWLAFRRLTQGKHTSVIVIIINVLLLSADIVAWPFIAFFALWSLGDMTMSFG